VRGDLKWYFGMKYIVLIGDGMVDRPLKELNNRTCLQVAKTPNMDRLAREGIVGMVSTLPPDLPAGSDVANLSILGYDPKKYYTGRAPLEAASIGVKMGKDDVAYRCNLVTMKTIKKRIYLEDYSAGHIKTEEAAQLIREIDKRLGSLDIRFYPGVSYRHLMVWKKGKGLIDCIPPHDITGKEACDYMPMGDGEEVLWQLMEESQAILTNHPVNKNRRKAGLKEANSLWFWGQGKRPSLPSFKDKYGLKGGLISAVDLMKGIGRYAGFKIIDVPGATGYLDTNYEGKAKATLSALKTLDFVYIHVASPDEASHNGDIRGKIKAIEDFDNKVVGTLMKGLSGIKGYKILLLSDHSTPIELRTHTRDPVPFVIYPSKWKKGKASFFDEDIIKKNPIHFKEGYKLIDYFLEVN
jgi:2,3-bisphosphoglycerate-independent phosphoglycerate mutase